jgi:hypothetical protein
MRARLILDVLPNGLVTQIAYSLYDDQGVVVRTWCGSPETSGYGPHSGLSDLLGRLNGASTQITLLDEDPF